MAVAVAAAGECKVAGRNVKRLVLWGGCEGLREPFILGDLETY